MTTTTTEAGDVCSTDITIDGIDITTEKYENRIIVAIADVLNLTFRYVFEPESLHRSDPYTLRKFQVNDHTYNQIEAGQTGLPGERAAAERVFKHVSDTYDISFNRKSVGYKVPVDLTNLETDEFTAVSSDNINVDLSLTLDGVDDKSGVTLSLGDTIYDLYTDEFYEVGILHSRGKGAIGRGLEFRRKGDDRFTEHNLQHVDLKLNRGRWRLGISPTVGITDLQQCETETTILQIGDVVTDMGEFPGLVDQSEFSIDRIVAVQGKGVYVVLVPETNFNSINDLNVRAYPSTDLSDITVE